MGVHSHTMTADVDPSVVWRRWTNVEEWPADEPGVSKAQLNGPLAKGALGWVRRPRGRRKYTFRIVEVTRRAPALRFVVESKLLLGTVRYVRTLERPEPGAAVSAPNAEAAGPDAAPSDTWVLTHSVVIGGPLATLWDRLLGRRLAGDLPAVVSSIVAEASV